MSVSVNVDGAAALCVSDDGRVASMGNYRVSVTPLRVVLVKHSLTVSNSMEWVATLPSAAKMSLLSTVSKNRLLAERRADRPHYVGASWSPVGLGNNGECVLATAASDGSAWVFGSPGTRTAYRMEEWGDLRLGVEEDPCNDVAWLPHIYSVGRFGRCGVVAVAATSGVEFYTVDAGRGFSEEDVPEKPPAFRHAADLELPDDEEVLRCEVVARTTSARGNAAWLLLGMASGCLDLWEVHVGDKPTDGHVGGAGAGAGAGAGGGGSSGGGGSASGGGGSGSGVGSGSPPRRDTGRFGTLMCDASAPVALSATPWRRVLPTGRPVTVLSVASTPAGGLHVAAGRGPQLCVWSGSAASLASPAVDAPGIKLAPLEGAAATGLRVLRCAAVDLTAISNAHAGTITALAGAVRGTTMEWFSSCTQGRVRWWKKPANACPSTRPSDDRHPAGDQAVWGLHVCCHQQALLQLVATGREYNTMYATADVAFELSQLRLEFNSSERLEAILAAAADGGLLPHMVADVVQVWREFINASSAGPAGVSPREWLLEGVERRRAAAVSRVKRALSARTGDGGIWLEASKAIVPFRRLVRTAIYAAATDIRASAGHQQVLPPELSGPLVAPISPLYRAKLEPAVSTARWLWVFGSLALFEQRCRGSTTDAKFRVLTLEEAAEEDLAVDADLVAAPSGVVMLRAEHQAAVLMAAWLTRSRESALTGMQTAADALAAAVTAEAPDSLPLGACPACSEPLREGDRVDRCACARGHTVARCAATLLPICEASSSWQCQCCGAHLHPLLFRNDPCHVLGARVFCWLQDSRSRCEGRLLCPTCGDWPQPPL